MTPWERWVHRPQSVWFRRILFQIHLWAGIAVGLYVAAISISGSALVYGPQLARKLRRTVVVADAGHTRMTVDDVQRRAHLAYKAYDVLSVTEPSRPDRPDVIVLEGHSGRIVRIWAIRAPCLIGPCDGSPIYTTTCWRVSPVVP